MKLVKFTNNNEQLKGMPVYLMDEHIVSVFEMPTDGGSLVTAIYGIRGDTWYVEEGLNEVVNTINGKYFDVR
jgi:uncharacterized protein YlzI (FlbEa/FlbD family)